VVACLKCLLLPFLDKSVMFYVVQLQSTKAVTIVMDCFCIQPLFYIVLKIVTLVIWMRLSIVLSMINIHGH